MHINREEFLRILETVGPGLASKGEGIQQAACFCFKEGRVMTFNDEVACIHKCPIDFEGAVRADKLRNLLFKMREETIELRPGKKHLVVKGKRKKAGIIMDSEVELPIHMVEKAGEYRPLPPEFCEALDLVQQCAGSNEEEFAYTCVHIGPKWIEASDRFQMSRYRLRTGFEEDTYVRRDSIKHIVPLGISKCNDTESWLHFKNDTGLRYSCRRYLEQNFPDLTQALKMKGSPVVLPKGIGDAIDLGALFAEDGSDDKQIGVELMPGKIRIHGLGAYGWFRQWAKLKYDGKRMHFLIPPKLFGDITKRYNDCEVSESKLKVDAGKLVYVTMLDSSAQEKEEQNNDD